MSIQRQHYMTVQPKVITSPTGCPCRPTVTERVVDGRVIKEATWRDTASGQIFKKGIISNEPVK